jgi:hypothetical protein
MGYWPFLAMTGPASMAMPRRRIDISFMVTVVIGVYVQKESVCVEV